MKGEIAFEPEGPVRAGEWGSWRFVYTAKGEVPAGGGIDILFPFSSYYPIASWSIPQTEEPLLEGYTTVESDGEVELEVEALPKEIGRLGMIYHALSVEVRKDLKPGERIVVTYGDRRKGGVGARVCLVAYGTFFAILEAIEDLKNRWRYKEDILKKHSLRYIERNSDHILRVAIVGGETKGINIAHPKVIRPGEEFRLRLRLLDAFMNEASTPDDLEVKLFVEGRENIFRKVTLKGGYAEVGDIHLDEEGVYRIFCIDGSGKVSGRSEVVVTEDKKFNYFWGEIHPHTEISDGIGTPDEHYRYARDVALLDFGAIADHNYSIEENPKSWEEITESTKEHNQPGKFVALFGMEVATSTVCNIGDDGHFNVYSHKRFPFLPSNLEGDFDAVLEWIKENELIAVPHHTLYSGMGMDFGRYPKDAFHLFEVFSSHGCSEYYDNPKRIKYQHIGGGRSLCDALRAGFRMGIIASSDYHDELMGGMLKLQEYAQTVHSSYFQFRGGYVCVLAEELTPEGIMDGLKKRRCYATAGDRIVIFFEINGHIMGETIETEDDSLVREVEVEVVGTNRIEKIELIRNCEPVSEHKGKSDHESITFRDESNLREVSIASDEEMFSFYYVRLVQADGEMAWTSPIWIVLEMGGEDA